MKRFISITLSILLIIGTIIPSLMMNPLDTYAASTVTPRDWKKYKSTYYYDTLSDAEKAVYDEFEIDCIDFISSNNDAFYSKENYVHISGDYYFIGGVSLQKVGLFDAMKILRQFIFDNPQYYFLEPDGVLIYGSGLNYYLASCVKPEFVDGDYRAGVTNAIFDKIENWESQVVAAGPSAYDMEMKADSIVCANIEYDHSDYDQNIYGAVYQGSSVCTGYAKTMSMLLNGAGIPAMIVRSSNHAWNLVNLNGTWYQSDPTWNYSWNKTIAGEPYAADLNSIYSNVSTATMHVMDSSESHDINLPEKYPACNSDYNTGTESDYCLEYGEHSKTVRQKSNPNYKMSYYDKGYLPTETAPVDVTIPDGSADGNKGGTNNTDNNSNNSNNANNNSNANNSNNTNNNSNNIDANNNNNGSNSSNTGSTDNGAAAPAPQHCNEWVNGLWYGADGSQTYAGTLTWKCNSTGWWVEDTSGWYPVSCWQKIDGYWYYFGSDGYMESSCWRDGCWLSGSGAWEYEGTATWKCNSTGWWFEDTSSWYAYSTWQKINGSWYYFGSDGYMVTNRYIDGWWIGTDGVCN